MPRQARLNESADRVQVVAGILCNTAGEILISDRAQARSMRDYWEFPGGKINAGESADAALCRELQEELGIDITEFRHFLSLKHDYPDLSVAIDFYTVSRWSGKPAGREGQHVLWVDKSSLTEHKLLPADAPVVAAICSMPNKY